VATTVNCPQKLTVPIGPLDLECGRRLKQVEIAVETAGTLSDSRDNVILVCHALTGDAHAVGDAEHPGWWDGLIGPGGYIDTNRYFVITTNVLGGCAGSTGPSSIDPGTGRPYGTSFPVVTIRDMVRAQRRCLEKMGISKIAAVIGGSMGGMQVLEWGIMYPEAVERMIPIATSVALSPMGIAYNDIGRQAILADPEWKGGNYYPGPGPRRGLAIARMMGMITYRTETLFEKRFSRRIQDDGPITRLDSMFQVESYLRYQGEKLVRRFDANSYLYLLKAMDLHDIGRGRGGVERALSRIQSDVLVIGIREDILFPIREQRKIHALLQRLGKRSRLEEIQSHYGHDAFLVEFDLVGPPIRRFLGEGRMRSS